MAEAVLVLVVGEEVVEVVVVVAAVVVVVLGATGIQMIFVHINQCPQ